MIKDPKERIIISSLGYVDGNKFWCLDTKTESVTLIPTPEGTFASVRQGEEGFFCAVQEHQSKEQRLHVDSIVITAHSFEDPGKVISKCIVAEKDQHFEGDLSIWKYLPRYYQGSFAFANSPWYHMMEMDSSNNVVFHVFDWFDETYDKDYQGICGITEIPDSPLLLISVSRNSKIIVFDLRSRKKTAEIILAGRLGNPELYLCRSRKELWASDYDTIVKVSLETWKKIDSKLLQLASLSHRKEMFGNIPGVDPYTADIRCFIGEFSFNLDEDICAVARPFGGDVIGLNPNTMEIAYKCELGLQPMHVALLRNGQIFARDWHSGKLLSGHLEPVAPY